MTFRSSTPRLTPAEQRERITAWARRNGAVSAVQVVSILGCNRLVALKRMRELVHEKAFVKTGLTEWKLGG